MFTPKPAGTPVEPVAVKLTAAAVDDGACTAVSAEAESAAFNIFNLQTDLSIHPGICPRILFPPNTFSSLRMQGRRLRPQVGSSRATLCNDCRSGRIDAKWWTVRRRQGLRYTTDSGSCRRTLTPCSQMRHLGQRTWRGRVCRDRTTPFRPADHLNDPADFRHHSTSEPAGHAGPLPCFTGGRIIATP